MRGRMIVAMLGALVIGALLAWMTPSVSFAADSPPDQAPVITLFHGEGCPHCAAEREFLADLVERHPQVQVELFEVWGSDENRALLERTANEMGFEVAGVPVTIIGEQVWIGFSEPIGAEIEAAVVAALGSQPPPTPDGATGATIDVPVIGPVDLASSSLLVSTIVIGFVDGVNPCSLWVLSLLLAIVLHRGSRGRVLAVGGVFLTITAAMYALYIVGMYSALDVIGSLTWVRLAVAAVALTFGVLQLKDGIRPGVGPSLSISDERKPGIYKRMRAIADPERGIAATLAGTVVLAVGVSLLETPCTAGLPLLWTNLLAQNEVGFGTAAALFVVYMLVFLLDELIVFAVAVTTLKATRMQERHGRFLKLLSGSVLVTLAAAMLFAPEAMNTVLGTVIVFAIAGVITTALWLSVRHRASDGITPGR